MVVSGLVILLIARRPPTFPDKPIDVRIVEDVQVDTVKIGDITGFWRKPKFAGAYIYHQQYEIRENGEYVFVVWDVTKGVPAIHKTEDAVYVEIGLWQLTSPNRIYFTVKNSSDSISVGVPYYYVLMRDGGFLWLGSNLWERGRW